MALPSKEAFLYVFDRVTGQPVWPIEERPVPQSDVPGEKTSPTQPFPTKPPAYARQAITVDELIDFTPELRAEALETVKMYRMGPMFLPAVVSKVGGPLAALTIGTLGGGTNWPGASYDPETHTVYAQAANAGVSPLGLVEPPKGFSDIRYVAGVAGREFRINEGPGFGTARRCAEGQRQRRAPCRAWRRGAAAGLAGTGDRGCGGTAGAARWRRRSDDSTAWRWSSRRTACCPRSISIAAIWCGRCRTATRPTRSAIIRRSKA